MNHIAIRRAVASDIERLVDIEVAAAQLFALDDLPAEAGRSGSHREIAQAISDALAWVAELPRDGAVGFLIARHAGDCLHVLEMDVLPSHARQGVGGSLLEGVCQHARHTGLRAVTLTTFEHIPWNAPFYARHEFAIETNPDAYAHLSEALRAEAAKGLKRRVAMRRNLG